MSKMMIQEKSPAKQSQNISFLKKLHLMRLRTLPMVAMTTVVILKKNRLEKEKKFGI